MNKYIFATRLFFTTVMLLAGILICMTLFMTLNIAKDAYLTDFMLFFTVPVCAISVAIAYLTGINEYAFTHLWDALFLGAISALPLMDFGLFSYHSFMFFTNLLFSPQLVIIILLHLQGNYLKRASRN